MRRVAGNWGLLATVLVVVVNQILKQSIVFSSPWLKSHTMEEELQVRLSQMLRD
jgi:hypothetical protein